MIFRIFVALIFVLSCTSANCQLIADAGSDTLLCENFLYSNLPFQIGGNPTASGGSGNYFYTWKTFYQSYTGVLTASDFLDDTTAGNPNIINSGVDSLIFHVSVVDASGNTSIDSVKIIFNQWVCNLGECIYFMSDGDSVQLWVNCYSNFQPQTYQWNPSYNISDISAEQPYVSPDSTTQYGLTTTDSRGCILQTPWQCVVNVYPASAPLISLFENISEVIPDPVNENSEIRFQNPFSKKMKAEIFNIIGEKILEESTSTNTIEIGNSIPTAGEYFYRISFAGKTISSGKFSKCE